MRQLNWIVVVIAVLWAPHSFSQDNMQKALARAQFMLKQVSAEKASLQNDNASLKSQIDDLKAELEKTRSKAKKEKAKLKGNISDWKTEYQALKQRMIDTSTALREMTSQKDDYADKLDKQTANYNLCFKDNTSLVAINNKLLEKFKAKGVWDAVVQAEPVTGLGKVEMENLVQKYQHKIEDVDLGMNSYQIKDIDK